MATPSSSRFGDSILMLMLMRASDAATPASDFIDIRVMAEVTYGSEKSSLAMREDMYILTIRIATIRGVGPLH